MISLPWKTPITEIFYMFVFAFSIVDVPILTKLLHKSKLKRCVHNRTVYNIEKTTAAHIWKRFIDVYIRQLGRDNY